MSGAGQTTDLAMFADALAEHRDRYIAQARAATGEAARCMAIGQAASLRMALAFLHTSTNGQYGAVLDDQPNPFAISTRPEVGS